MPRYLVRTPFNTYAVWSTIADAFGGEMTPLEADMEHQRPAMMHPDYTWAQCLRTLVLIRGAEGALENLKVFSSPLPQEWLDYVYALSGEDFDTTPPAMPADTTPKPPHLCLRVLTLTLRAITLPDIPNVIFLPLPPPSPNWKRETLAMISLVDALYFPDEGGSVEEASLLRNLAHYASASGKEVYTPSRLEILRSFA